MVTGMKKAVELVEMFAGERNKTLVKCKRCFRAATVLGAAKGNWF